MPMSSGTAANAAATVLTISLNFDGMHSTTAMPSTGAKTYSERRGNPLCSILSFQVQGFKGSRVQQFMSGFQPLNLSTLEPLNRRHLGTASINHNTTTATTPKVTHT